MREIVMEFDYLTPDGRRSMLWRRSKGWNRRFLRRKESDVQPLVEGLMNALLQ